MRNRAASRVAQAHLRALVSRLRGCLSALSSQQQRLLSLRAGLNGTPAGAGAVARILNIGPQREALLERLSLVALRSAAASGCAGSQASSSPTLTSAANAAGAGGQLVSSVSYLPTVSPAAAAGHPASGTGKVSAPSAGAPAGSSPGSTGRPAKLAAAGIQRAAVTSTQSPALTLVVLMLLLGTVVLLRPWRRRSLLPNRISAPSAAPVTRATPTATAPAPIPAQPAPIPAQPAPTSARPAPAAPTANSAARPDPGRASREPGWLRDHAAQGALVATAVAGVIARGLARRSGTGRRR